MRNTNPMRYFLMQYARLRDKEPSNFLCQVLEFKQDSYTAKVSILGLENEIILDNVHVFCNPLTTLPLPNDSYGILIRLGFDYADFFETKQLSPSLNSDTSYIMLPLNLNYSNNTTLIQSLQNADAKLEFTNNSTTLQTNDQIKLELANTTTLLNQQSEITLSDTKITLNCTQLETESNTQNITANTLNLKSFVEPLNLNDSNIGQALEIIASNLTELSASLKPHKIIYTPSGLDTILGVAKKVQ